MKAEALIPCLRSFLNIHLLKLHPYAPPIQPYIYYESFGEGIIIPIYKGGDIENPQKYRGITLINIISKMYSQILLNCLTNWTQTNETIIENQFGFQTGKSTIDCVYILHSIIAKTLSLKKNYIVVL
jgi:hypothetical protein